MNIYSVTVAPNGQIVLPVDICNELSIHTGSELVAFTSGDTIMLKIIHAPNKEDFGQKLNDAQAWAEEVGYTKNDVNKIIKEVRQRKRA